MKGKVMIWGVLLCGALVWTSCGQKKAEAPVNENENATEKVEVKDVEGRKNFGDAGIITPLPAIMIATYDEKENPDVMMAAWGGQCGPKHICFNLSAHKTTENIRLKKAFTVSFASKNDIVQSDYFGIVSANDVPDKVARAGFTVTKSPNVDAPIVNEYPLTLECKVLYRQPQDLSLIPEDLCKTYYPQDVDSSFHRANRDAHIMYIGQIVDAYIIR